MSEVVHKVRDVIQGQAQAAVVEPHDGSVEVRETAVKLDTVITDANSPEAVQIPEEAGTVQDRLALPIERLEDGTPEEKFAEAKSSKK